MTIQEILEKAAADIAAASWHGEPNQHRYHVTVGCEVEDSEKPVSSSLGIRNALVLSALCRPPLRYPLESHATWPNDLSFSDIIAREDGKTVLLFAVIPCPMPSD